VFSVFAGAAVTLALGVFVADLVAKLVCTAGAVTSRVSFLLAQYFKHKAAETSQRNLKLKEQQFAPKIEAGCFIQST
jgi:hypothetical protein